MTDPYSAPSNPVELTFPTMNDEEAEKELRLYADSFAKDPLGFVKAFYPWGKPGTELEHETGPEKWQVDVLTYIGANLSPHTCIQIAVSAGHGVGKSALVAWIVDWAMSTFPDTRCVITANTEAQLTTKTWAEGQRWYRMLLNRHWFNWTATQLLSSDKEHEKSWSTAIQPYSETRPESFAGLHNKGRRTVVMFDEASAIPDKIWETTEGAMTDIGTERIWLVFGNPTRNTGRFKDCFEKFANYWKTFKVDARTVRFTDKSKHDQWEKSYGEDSDFFRVRVRGEFPRAGSVQFISSEVVAEAQRREARCDRFDPTIIGVDVARFGANSSVIYIRKGYDGRTFKYQKYNGLDTVQLATKVVEIAEHYSADAIFIDETGLGVGCLDVVRSLNRTYGITILGVNFSAKADGVHFDGQPVKYANKRAEIYGRMREWLKFGAIPDDVEIRNDLIGVEYGYNGRGETQLESKQDMEDRGLESPDIADALACTFAYPVPIGDGRTRVEDDEDTADYDPYKYLDKIE